MVDVVDSKSTGASLSAACGGSSEGVAGAAVGEGRRRSRQGHSPGTANVGDIRRRMAATINSRQRGQFKKQNTPAGVMEW